MRLAGVSSIKEADIYDFSSAADAKDRAAIAAVLAHGVASKLLTLETVPRKSGGVDNYYKLTRAGWHFAFPSESKVSAEKLVEYAQKYFMWNQSDTTSL